MLICLTPVDEAAQIQDDWKTLVLLTTLRTSSPNGLAREISCHHVDGPSLSAKVEELSSADVPNVLRQPCVKPLNGRRRQQVRMQSMLLRHHSSSHNMNMRRDIHKGVRGHWNLIVHAKDEIWTPRSPHEIHHMHPFLELLNNELPNVLTDGTGQVELRTRPDHGWGLLGFLGFLLGKRFQLADPGTSGPSLPK